MTHFKSVPGTVVLVLYCSTLGYAQEHRIIFKNNEASLGLSESLGDTNCTTPNGIRGECISILNCSSLLNLINSPDQREFLKQSRCGWDGDCPLVCCAFKATENTKRTCTISEMQWLYSLRCKPYVTIYATCLNLTRKRCRSETDECCIPELTYNINSHTSPTPTRPSKSSDCVISSMPPDVTSGCCGKEASIHKILPGELAKIDQYTWTALIGYAGSDTIRLRCGGTLISGRYVLTAAHCLFIENANPVNVRLGDFYLVHLDNDCVVDDNMQEFCTDGEVTILIEKTIPHPDYSVSSRTQTNDIALIRLQDPAPYTEFIRPVCLPSSSDFTETAEDGIKLHVAGWGVMRDGEIQNQLKWQFEISFVTLENCFKLYRQLNILVGDGHICAGGGTGLDRHSCYGDTGGALMLRNNNRTEIVGIGSLSLCGHTNKPAIYTKVFHYLPWIRNNIN